MRKEGQIKATGGGGRKQKEVESFKEEREKKRENSDLGDCNSGGGPRDTCPAGCGIGKKALKTGKAC